MILLVNIAMIVSAPVKQTFNIEGMMCGYGCVNTINKTLQSLEGVETYIVNFEGKSMEVTFDDQILTSDKVISSLPNPYVVSLVDATIAKEYFVTGITCMGCVNSINKSLENVKGLKVYNLDYEKNILSIEFEIDKTDANKIITSIPTKFQLKEIVDTKNNPVKEEI